VEDRILGRTGRAVSVVGLGTWQLGADWGEVDEASALAVLDAAAQAGVTFLDTADVYGDGRSERLIGQFLAANPGLPMMVATKMGRRVPQDPAQYTLANFRAWTDRSRANLGTDTLDLVQLHSPAPGTRPRRGRTPAPPPCPRSPVPSCRTSRTSTTGGSGPRCTTAGSGQHGAGGG
jgi:aryl-alcohol dehydrogenase-like predicted oxidoreductase